MTNLHGDFIWYELLTKDADAAADFYGKAIGWTSTRAGQPGVDYRFFSSGDGNDTRDGVGGFMAITPEMAEHGTKPAWLGYIAVDDVDSSAARITASGGGVLMPAMDMESVGRMAMVTDPQGAPFYLMKGASDETSHSFAAYEPKVGHCAWNELATSDPESAKAFYTSHFGWAKEGETDMGPMGKYEIMKASGGRFTLGGVYPMLPEDDWSHWLFYFRVPNINAAITAAENNGGHIRVEPIEVPEREDWTVQACDPDGAWFGLIGPRL